MRELGALVARDRVGIGWRPALAAGILAHLDRIDLAEVIAEDWLEAGRAERRALRALGRLVPVWLHGTSLGLASSEAVGAERLERLARLVGEVAPEGWSEHLAFVRAGGVEIGHLAAPPRREDTLAGLGANLARARRVIGSAPLVENVATLVAPPASSMDEGEWLARVAGELDAELLLDLHNLHANAVNFGFDAAATLARLPLDRVGLVHIAGGCWIPEPHRSGRQRLLDDHLHAVPDPVYGLLEELAARAPGPLSVVLERDGRFPPMAELLAELDQARAALARGRARRAREAA